MTNPEPAAHEASRVTALNRYLIMDTLQEKSYDAVTALASSICNTPISLVSLVDADRQWFKSALGLEARETPRSQSFCAHTIPTATTLVVADAQQDTRFMDNPLVVGSPGIRFYAGAPIVEPGGHVIGTVCVIDTTPRRLTFVQISALEALARYVMAMMELRRALMAISPDMRPPENLSPGS